jgi:hypothetical protein
MPFAYIAREEVEAFAAQQIDPKTKRPLTGSQRAMYLVAYLCIPTSGPQAEKPENERVVEEARSSFAKHTGFSERTIQRGYPALERCGLIQFTEGGRAGPANVHTRQWQRFTLPKAPRGHWRVIVPRHVRKQRQREEADRNRRKQRLLDLLERAPGDASRIGVAVQKIAPSAVAGTLLGTETESLPLPPPQSGEGGGRSASLRGSEGERLRRSRVSPEQSSDEGARLRRELSPEVAAKVAADWGAKVLAASAKGRENRRRRALGLPDLPDDDPDPL